MSGNTSQEQELIRLEHELVEVLKRADVERFTQLMSDDWSTIDPRGQILTKQEVAEVLRSGTLKIESMNADDLTTRVYGDTAVVTGRGSYRLSGSGPEIADYAQATFRFTDVWVKRAHGWQCVATQQTRIQAT